MKNFLIYFLFLPFSCCCANLQMGRCSYGTPKIYSWGEDTKVIIGNFCSIAEGVEIMKGGEHRPDWITTYPFNVRWPNKKSNPGHPKTKGNVVIGNDVWIAKNAFILSGVTIGDGAVIGAHCVVAKNVPAYAIVVGNPAKIIRYRFDEQTIKDFLTIAWWYWSDKEIVDALPLLTSSNISEFIDYCRIRGKL